MKKKHYRGYFNYRETYLLFNNFYKFSPKENIYMLCFYGMLRYMSSIAILTPTRDQATHIAQVLRPILFIDPNYTTTNPLIARPLSGSLNSAW